MKLHLKSKRRTKTIDHTWAEVWISQERNIIEIWHKVNSLLQIKLKNQNSIETLKTKVTLVGSKTIMTTTS